MILCRSEKFKKRNQRVLQDERFENNKSTKVISSGTSTTGKSSIMVSEGLSSTPNKKTINKYKVKNEKLKERLIHNM